MSAWSLSGCRDMVRSVLLVHGKGGETLVVVRALDRVVVNRVSGPALLTRRHRRMTGAAPPIAYTISRSQPADAAPLSSCAACARRDGSGVDEQLVESVVDDGRRLVGVVGAA